MKNADKLKKMQYFQKILNIKNNITALFMINKK